jgi:hypothetical protein
MIDYLYAFVYKSDTLLLLIVVGLIGIAVTTIAVTAVAVAIVVIGSCNIMIKLLTIYLENIIGEHR